LTGSSSYSEAPVVVSLILAVCLALFYKLKITIEDETLCASFGSGIYPQESAACGCCCMRIHSHSLVVWLGVHLTPFGWLYNVSGFDAVAITLRDGRKFALGTDDPHGLATAIRAGIS